MIKKVKFFNLLNSSNNILKKIEKEIKNEIESTLELSVNLNSKEFLLSLKNNFFTLLMLSILKNEKISEKNIIEYGKIIVYLRQIITSTDNIIDSERKGFIRSNKLSNLIVENSLIQLLCKNLVSKSLIKLGDTSLELDNKLLTFIGKIAYSENLRNVNTSKEYPTYEYILNSIHSGIGGNLLELSLIIPISLEDKTTSDSLLNYSKGLYLIGMALQNLDDYFDMKEDFYNSKYNLYSSILIEKNICSQEALEAHLNGSNDFIELFSKELKSVKENTLKGLSLFMDQGFPITEEDSLILLKELFKVRGMEKEYNLLY